jgi:hypothetical protein
MRGPGTLPLPPARDLPVPYWQQTKTNFRWSETALDPVMFSPAGRRFTFSWQGPVFPGIITVDYLGNNYPFIFPGIQIGSAIAVVAPPGTASGGGAGYPLRYWQPRLTFTKIILDADYPNGVPPNLSFTAVYY